MALQVAEVLRGNIDGFSYRLADALADQDIGLAVTLADVTIALATRQLVFAGDYASAVRILEQLQMGLYRERLSFHRLRHWRGWQIFTGYTHSVWPAPRQ